MAGTNKNRTKKPSSQKANALGFSKRRSRLSKASTKLSDVYEFQNEKVRRSGVALALGRDDIAGVERQNNSDNEEEWKDPSKGARLIGENEDNEMIDSEDDEDIDSDAAFGDSDEETFAGYGFSRKVARIYYCVR
jgi:U3 small nucleolar RNA-associated protein 14